MFVPHLGTMFVPHLGTMFVPHLGTMVVPNVVAGFSPRFPLANYSLMEIAYHDHLELE